MNELDIHCVCDAQLHLPHQNWSQPNDPAPPSLPPTAESYERQTWQSAVGGLSIDRPTRRPDRASERYGRQQQPRSCPAQTILFFPPEASIGPWFCPHGQSYVSVGPTPGAECVRSLPTTRSSAYLLVSIERPPVRH
jgi:hypothetical protein